MKIDRKEYEWHHFASEKPSDETINRFRNSVEKNYSRGHIAFENDGWSIGIYGGTKPQTQYLPDFYRQLGDA